MKLKKINNYYISLTGDDNGNGTFVKPWKTFKHAVDQLKTGDTLYILDGTYFEPLNISNKHGQPNSKINIKAKNKMKVILQTPPEYFNWNDIPNEVTENNKLINFLKNNFGINLDIVKNVIKTDNKITVSALIKKQDNTEETQFHTLILKPDKNKVSIIIYDGRTCELDAVIKNNTICIKYLPIQPIISIIDSSYICLHDLTLLDSGWHGVAMSGANQCKLLGLEVRRPNKLLNTHGISLFQSSHNNIENCIVREFHRDGIQMYWSDKNIIRQCYVNGGQRENCTVHGVTGGVAGISCYFGNDNTIENCQSIDVAVGFENKGCSRNKFLNCVALHSPNYREPLTVYNAGVNDHFLSGFCCSSDWHQDTMKWLLSEGVSFVNCIAHSNYHGFILRGVASAELIQCVSFLNKKNGYKVMNNVEGPSFETSIVPTVSAVFRKCAALENTIHGWYFEERLYWDVKLFNWSNITEKDKKTLKHFLTWNFGINLDNATIEKINETTISVFEEENGIPKEKIRLTLNNDKVSIEIYDGRIGELIVKINNGEQDVWTMKYDQPTSYLLKDCLSFGNDCQNDLPKGDVVSVPPI